MPTQFYITQVMHTPTPQLDFGDVPIPRIPRCSRATARGMSSWDLNSVRSQSEADGQPNATATGDDLAGVDDEDGVTFSTLVTSATSATVGTAQVVVTNGPAQARRLG